MKYDADGNLTNDGTLTYTWNGRNQLTALSGAHSASFTYDALGRRESATIDGTTTGYLYDGLNPVQEQDSTATTNLLTGLNPDEYFERSDGTTTRYFLTDAQNSTVALTDPSGTVVKNYAYDPYGATTATGETSTNPFQYTGRENDNTGLYYYRARYYDPGIGRFISSDPIGLAGGLNTYTYADGNPVRFADPLGLWTFQMGFSGSYYATLDGVGIGVTGGFGFAIDGHGNITTYGYRGKGGALGTPGASGGVQIAVSNGNTVCDLAGPFNNANLGGGWGPDATGDAFWGTGSQGQRVEGGGLTIGGGIGGSAFVGQTNTQLGNIGHLW